jgi:pimeloyl-ACP methyl ester carboxylesterase
VTIAAPAPVAATGTPAAAFDPSATAALADGAFVERIVRFGERECLVGVLCLPGGAAPSGPAAILVNHGMLHRVGPNRLHVKLARRLARAGHAVLRFDFSGMGDSGNRPDKLPYEQRVVVEAREAMAFLEQAIGATHFVLGGLCSGAIASYETAKVDPRVAGVILMNPQFFDDELTSYVEARRTDYWRRVLTNPRRWYELFSGKAQYRMLALRIKGLFVREKQAHDRSGQIAADLERLVRRGTRVLMAYSTYDYGLDYLKMIVASARGDWTRSDCLRIEKVPRADHVFTGLDSQRHLLAAVEDWLGALR